MVLRKYSKLPFRNLSVPKFLIICLLSVIGKVNIMGKWYLEFRRLQAGHVGTRRNAVHLKYRRWILMSSVTQSCLTLCDPMNCSLPGSSVHGHSPGKNTRVCCHPLLQGIFPTQGSNAGLLHCRWILCHLSHLGKPMHPGFLAEWYWKSGCSSLGLWLLVNATEGLGFKQNVWVTSRVKKLMLPLCQPAQTLIVYNNQSFPVTLDKLRCHLWSHRWKHLNISACHLFHVVIMPSWCSITKKKEKNGSFSPHIFHQLLKYRDQDFCTCSRHHDGRRHWVHSTSVVAPWTSLFLKTPMGNSDVESVLRSLTGTFYIQEVLGFYQFLSRLWGSSLTHARVL